MVRSATRRDREANGKFEVEDTIHLQGGKIGHIGHMVSGMFQTGEAVTLKVDEENRALIGRNHSATPSSIRL